MTWAFQDRDLPMRHLIHDHDTKVTDAFAMLFEAEGVEMVAIPYQAPNAHAWAERWVPTVREECLDRLFILNEPPLGRVWHASVAYYTARRPHQELKQDSPGGMLLASPQGPVPYRKVLGDLIRDYSRKAA